MSSSAGRRRADFLKYWCRHGIKRPQCCVCDGAEGYVYFSGGGSRFHGSPECPALVQGQNKVEARKGQPEQLQAVRTVRATEGRKPCGTCRPPVDTPKPTTTAPRIATSSRTLPTTAAADRATHEVGPLTLIDSRRWDPIEGESIRGGVGNGDAYVVTVKAPSLDIDIADISWHNGDREVRVYAARQAPDDIGDLVGRCRVGITMHTRDVLALRLRIPRRPQRNRRPTLHQTDLRELDRVTGLDVRDLLLQWGATGVGPRSQVLGDQTRQAHELYVALRDPDNESLLPIVACCITHVLPFVAQNSARPDTRASSRRRDEPRATTIAPDDIARLVAFLESRICGKCHDSPVHAGCREASELRDLLSG